MLNDEINDILDYLQFEFKYRTLKNRLVALEEINKIERLQEQVKNCDYLILDSKTRLLSMKKKTYYIIL